MKMRSNVDLWNDREIVGWIADETDLNRLVAIEIVADDRVTRTVTADLLRQDLAEAGYGDGRHGFAVPDFKAAILGHGAIGDVRRVMVSAAAG